MKAVSKEAVIVPCVHLAPYVGKDVMFGHLNAHLFDVNGQGLKNHKGEMMKVDFWAICDACLEEAQVQDGADVELAPEKTFQLTHDTEMILN